MYSSIQSVPGVNNPPEVFKLEASACPSKVPRAEGLIDNQQQTTVGSVLPFVSDEVGLAEESS